MSKANKTYEKVMSGTANANIPFDEMCNLLSRLGFKERINGSHHKYSKGGVVNILVLQPGNDGKSKPYQVRQVKDLITIHNLQLS